MFLSGISVSKEKLSMADKYNLEAVEILAKEALRLPIAEAVPIHEQILAVFPTAAKYWKQYVEAHMAVNNDDAVKQIFSRCLLNCLNIPLWLCYLRFIKKVNKKKGMEGQEETRKAYDFTLNYIGADIGSGPVWIEYIAFLKSLPVQETTAVRKAYHRAIVTPTHQIEQIWRDYENFENSLSPSLAKGFLCEYQPKYDSARAVYRERRKHMDEIDWDMLSVPLSGSSKEEMQWMAWKRILAFEKGNPQKLDTASVNKRIAFTYEQCLMYLYHYPDIWYDYATWHAKAGSTDSAIKVFHKAFKALPDSTMLHYAYAELEESSGSIQAAKKVYQSLQRDDSNVTALLHIQFIRFLRRTEGVEAARKYFMDARKSPTCTYHVYAAYAMMVFCLDKDAKFAHNVFEAGLKCFMHEPSYILQYADFLSCLNDDQNIRALFERALSQLPPGKSVEIWKRYAEVEQTYGDLASMLKVEQRRKEALSTTRDDGESILECSLKHVVSRYSFKDLRPCSSKDRDHLARQEQLSRNINKKMEKPALTNVIGSADNNSSGVPMSSDSAKVVHPDTSKMMIGLTGPVQPVTSILPSSNVTLSGARVPNALNDTLKTLPPALAALVANLPAVEGPSPDVDFVISVCLQSNIPLVKGKSMAPAKQKAGPSPSTSNLSGSAKYKSTTDRHSRKRKHQERQDDDDSTVESQPPLRDAFRLRHLQRTHGTPSNAGSTSYGSAFSGEL